MARFIHINQYKNQYKNIKKCTIIYKQMNAINYKYLMVQTSVIEQKSVRSTLFHLLIYPFFLFIAITIYFNWIKKIKKIRVFSGMNRWIVYTHTSCNYIYLRKYHDKPLVAWIASIFIVIFISFIEQYISLV